MFPHFARRLLVVMTAALLAAASVLSQERRIRIIDVTPAMSIRSQIQPTDDIVVLTRQTHGAMPDPNRTFQDDIEDSVSASDSGAILLIEVTDVKGQIKGDGNWLASDVTARVVSTIWNPAQMNFKSHIQFSDPTGGEITIGKATVKTDDVLFRPGHRYIVFLRTLDEKVTPSRYPLLVQNDHVFNNWDLTHKTENPDPLHRQPLSKVLDALKKASRAR